MNCAWPGDYHSMIVIVLFLLVFNFIPQRFRDTATITRTPGDGTTKVYSHESIYFGHNSYQSEAIGITDELIHQNKGGTRTSYVALQRNQCATGYFIHLIKFQILFSLFCLSHFLIFMKNMKNYLAYYNNLIILMFY